MKRIKNRTLLRTGAAIGVASALVLTVTAQAATPRTGTDSGVDYTDLSALKGFQLSAHQLAVWTAEQERLAAEQAAAEAARVAAEQAAAEAARVAAEKAAADKAAAEAARKAAAARASRAAASRPAVTPGSAREIGQQLAAARGWSGEQWACLDMLWSRESGWRTNAGNPSGAYGIPQALPGSKMASAGADWRDSAATQITWGLNYIGGRHGSPCGAWQHFQARHWY
jgi:pyruvate/2-oxoglutarate dehydrogenase complex dihydrolipoamide acyltransferase (E2) component